MNVLLVEPDKLLANTYAQSLSAEGHDVIWSASAQQAIFAADARTPDIVVLEPQLVSHSGIEFLYEFRSYTEWQDIPVVIMSQIPPAEFVDSERLLVEELGVTQYLYKPHTTLQKLNRALA